MSTSARPEVQHYGTIVLGAGMAGLSSAAKLYEQSRFRAKNSLLVLEARDRIGGRIGSVYVNGSRLDTGANWIHGIGTDEAPNPLVKVLPHKRYRELSGSVAFRTPAEHEAQDDWVKVDSQDSTSVVRSEKDVEQGDLVIPPEHAGPLMGTLWGMIGSLHELAEATEASAAKQTTILQAINKTGMLQEARRSLPNELHRTLGAMPQFVENMEAAPLVAQSAEQPQGQSGMSLLEYAIDDFDGDQVFLQDGYTAVVTEVAKDLVDAGLVKLGTEVKQINWNAKPVTIETTSGTYSTDRLVCTLPLGILQKHEQPKKTAKPTAPLFQPQLPQEKREAITSLGFGTLDKIFLVYSQPWWTKEPFHSIFQKGFFRRPDDSDEEEKSSAADETSTFDTITGFTDELAGIKFHEDGSTTSGLRVLSLINLHNLTGFPVLSAFVSCANATHVESLSNDQAGGILHRAMTRWLGQEPPKPDAVHVTRWAQDEYSRGSYSHMITGLSERKHREAFQQPIINNHGAELRFAGEHTSSDHFATVHGALLSGWREADEILKATSESV